MGGMRTAVQGYRHLGTTGASHSRYPECKVRGQPNPERDQARDKDGNATAWGDEIGPGLGKGQVARRKAGQRGDPGDATGGPHVGGRARPPSFRQRLGCPQTLHRAPPKPQQRERSLPSRSHSPRRLRSRQLKRHMQLLFPATAARNPPARHARARQ